MMKGKKGENRKKGGKGRKREIRGRIMTKSDT